jgi:hypothetical protein
MNVVHLSPFEDAAALTMMARGKTTLADRQSQMMHGSLPALNALIVLQSLKHCHQFFCSFVKSYFSFIDHRQGLVKPRDAISGASMAEFSTDHLMSGSLSPGWMQMYLPRSRCSFVFIIPKRTASPGGLEIRLALPAAVGRVLKQLKNRVKDIRPVPNRLNARREDGNCRICFHIQMVYIMMTRLVRAYFLFLFT